MYKLTGKLQTWGLSDRPEDVRKYININTNYGLLRRFICTNVYDPFKNEGEQRIAKKRNINKIKKAISEGNYTPQAFNVAVSDLDSIVIDEKDNVTVPLSEKNKLFVLDAGTRVAALESLREEGGSTTRKIDDLPIPIICYLYDKRKDDFLNLNSGEHVNRSHILSMLIDNGRIGKEKLSYMKTAQSLAVALHTSEDSPLRDKVQFGYKEGDGSLALSVLCTDRSASIIASLFGTAKILDIYKKDVNYFVNYFNILYKLIRVNTDCTQPKKLLALPPDGAKSSIHNVLSIANVVLYYLYLMDYVDRPNEIEDYKDEIVDCVKIYDQLVKGDVSNKRRVELTGAFTQKLFNGLDEDKSFDENNVVFHFGIPLGLLNTTKYSGFGVEAPPVAKKSTVPDRVESVDSTIVPSDTDEEWEN